MFQHKKYLNKYNIHYLFLFCKCPKRHTHKIQSKIHRFVTTAPKIEIWPKSNMITIMRLFLHPPEENAMFREKQSLFFATKKV